MLTALILLAATRCTVPTSFRAAVRKFESHYTTVATLHPCFLAADFDGDGRKDLAVLVRDRTTNKTGIALHHSGDGTWHIIGAGSRTMEESAGDDFSTWLGAWSIHPRNVPVEKGVEAGEPPKLRGDALLLEEPESASGIVYWSGTRYVWYQQGD
jgi:hypothetical protein